MLDGKGLHRIHGLGLEYRGEGALLLLPSGGGKTTMTMGSCSLLRDRGVRLISEDSPLIPETTGPSCPFRCGSEPIPARCLPGIEPRYLRHIQRMEYDAKLTLDVRPFADRLCKKEVKPGVLLLGDALVGPQTRRSPRCRARPRSATR